MTATKTKQGLVSPANPEMIRMEQQTRETGMWGDGTVTRAQLTEVMEDKYLRGDISTRELLYSHPTTRGVPFNTWRRIREKIGELERGLRHVCVPEMAGVFADHALMREADAIRTGDPLEFPFQEKDARVTLRFSPVSISMAERDNTMRMFSGGYLTHMLRVDSGLYAVMRVNSEIMMSDTPMERRTNKGILNDARGHVLIAGLGIGMLLTVLPFLREVEHVTVVEKDADVLALTGPVVRETILRGRPEWNEKVTLVHADAFEYVPERKIDTLYLDIWPEISTDNLPDRRKLRAHYRKHMNKDGQMSAWVENELLSLRNRENREDRRYGWKW